MARTKQTARKTRRTLSTAGELTHSDVKALLTRDATERRRRKFGLLKDSELSELVMRFRGVEGELMPGFAPDLVVVRPRWGEMVFPVVSDGTLSSSTVWDALKKRAPHLEKIFEVGGGHVLAAGGAVLHSLSGTSPRRYYGDNGDIDLFFHGLPNADAATELLRKIIREVFEPIRDTEQVFLSRSQFAVTVSIGRNYYDRRIYQFILRLYASPDLVLGGFDLGACAAGYSPETGLVCTELAGWSIALSCIFVDCSRRSATFEKRLAKYAQRGFCVIFPSVTASDSDLAFNGTKLQIHHETMTYAGQNENETVSRHIYRIWGVPNEGGPESDYADEHLAIMSYSNIIKAVQGEMNIASLMLVGDSADELFEKPKIPGQVRLLELYRKRVSRRHRNANIPVLTLLQRWYGEDTFDMLRAQLTENKEEQERIMLKVVDRIGKVLEEAAASNRRKLEWNVLNPQTQLTGSFHPVNEHPKQFYNDSPTYRETLIGLPTREHAFLLRILFSRFPRDLRDHIVLDYVIPAHAGFVLEQLSTRVTEARRKAEEAEKALAQSVQTGPVEGGPMVQAQMQIQQHMPQAQIQQQVQMFDFGPGLGPFANFPAALPAGHGHLMPLGDPNLNVFGGFAAPAAPAAPVLAPAAPAAVDAAAQPAADFTFGFSDGVEKMEESP